jgi:TonB family protein
MKRHIWRICLCLIPGLQGCADNVGMVNPSPASHVQLINGLPTPHVDQNGNRIAVVQKAGALKYPKTLLQNSVEGLVIVEYEITQAGSVRDARVLFSDPAGLFDQPAIETISGWTFLPKLVHGVAVVSTRRNALTFCADSYPKPPDQRFRPCIGEAEKAAYLAEISHKYQKASNVTAGAP